MKYIFQQLINSLFLWRRLGIINGIRYWKGSHSRTGAVDIHPPKYQHPVYLRNGTSDYDTFSSTFLFGEFNLSLPLPDKPVILDLGANIGCSSVYLAHKYPQARIIAVEPELSNFECLERNTKPYPCIKCCRYALWTHNDGVDVVDTKSGKWGFRTENHHSDAGTTSTPSITINKLLLKEGLDYVDLMKIDIEGAERELFSGGTGWIRQVGAMVIELHDQSLKGCSRAFYQAITQYDFKQSFSGEKVIIRFDHAR